MNTPPNSTKALAQSLREILASRGIESSADRDRRKAHQRLQRMLLTQTVTPLPGIEVTYLEVDPSMWEQVGAGA